MDVVISIPHAVPYDPLVHRDGFLLDSHEMNKHVDPCTDALFHVPGIPAVRAEYPRWLGDVNRARHDFSGLGVLPYLHPHGLHARAGVPEYAEELLREAWDPFHNQLERLVGPGVLVLDGHAMDENGNWQGQDTGARPDICLMTQNGTSCPGWVTDLMQYRFHGAGYDTKVNTPYDEGYIMHRAGQLGGFAVGVEVNKALYLDPATQLPNATDVRTLNAVVRQIVEDIQGKRPRKAA